MRWKSSKQQAASSKQQVVSAVVYAEAA